MKTEQNNEYNDEPVYYCGCCHSLAITPPDESLADDGWDGSYCLNCGSTEIKVATIFQWLREEELMRKKNRR